MHITRAVLSVLSLASLSAGAMLIVQDGVIVLGIGSLSVGVLVGVYARCAPDVYRNTLCIDEARSPRSRDDER